MRELEDQSGYAHKRHPLRQATHPGPKRPQPEDPLDTQRSSRRQLLAGMAGAVIGGALLVAEPALRATPASAAPQMVDLISSQTVGGVKTFSAAPIVPNGAFPQVAIAGLVASLDAKQGAIAPGTYVATDGATMTQPLVFSTGEPRECAQIGALAGALTPVVAVQPGPDAPTDSFGVMDVLIKGSPHNFSNIGVVWVDICSSNKSEVEAFVYQAIRVGKHRGPNPNGSGAGGYGYVSVVDGDENIGNNIIKLPLVLQNLGGPVGIGVTPHSSAQLDAPSTTKGFRPPCMTTTQRDAISAPAEGLTIYNLTTHTLNVHNGTTWTAATLP